MRVVFMGTSEFAVPALEALVHNKYEVVAVYAQPDEPAGRGLRIKPPPVKRVALEHNLRVYQPQSLRPPEELQRLTALHPDLIVITAYGKILPESFLLVPSKGCLNIHASLLPRHRGPSPIAAAILAGDEVTGVTIMIVTKVVDAGPILAQRQVPILPHDTAGSLSEKLSGLGAELLIETLPGWLEGELVPQPQDDYKATYSKMITKEDGMIDWRRSAIDLWRRVRAFQPWPGCYTTWQGHVLKIIEAVPLPGEGVPGQVVALSHASDAPIGVYTGRGMLGLIQVQLEGKRAMSSADFARGHRSFVGSRLPS